MLISRSFTGPSKHMTLSHAESVSLDDIQRPVERELELFEQSMRKVVASHVNFVNLIMRYILRRKGKRVRPAIVLLSAKACGGVAESTYRAATLVEVIHTATLVHDDVVDEAEKRRGFWSVNALWKSKVAVLIGDYLFARGLIMAVESEDYFALQAISNAVRKMSEGELLQIKKSRSLNVDEATYLEIIRSKTAVLFSTCAETGAASVTTDATKRTAMSRYGDHLGMAFQIRDDILDLTGTSALLGKPVGADLKERKLTLPIIYALKQCGTRESKQVLRDIKIGVQSRQARRICNFVMDYGGVAYANLVARQHSNLARESLALLPPSSAKQSLLDLATFAAERNK
jgi:octaprenyl-diphosphate synthase